MWQDAPHVVRNRIRQWLGALDAVVIAGVLAFALIAPLGFLVPFNDEWLRTNYLAGHSPWEWTVMHCQTWVVRPTAELIMSWASLVTAQRMLPQPLTAARFLLHFQLPYLALVLSLLGLLYAFAAIVAERARALSHWAFACACMLICLCVSDELGYAFYWADGYANVVLPFVLMLIGLALFARQGVARALGCALLLLAALGHEVLCIFSCGFCVLQAFAPAARARERVLTVVLLATLLAILYAQGFSAGPAERSRAYFAQTGQHYNWAGAWDGLMRISLTRSAIAIAATWASLAVMRERLSSSIVRAVRCTRERPWFCALLALGTLATSALPLASVGLKKAKFSGDAYSVASELFVILAAVFAYPWLDRWLGPALRPYRERVRSVVPVLLLVLLTSPNLSHYRAALAGASELRAAAFVYFETLLEGRGKRVRVARPCHPFNKRATGMTSRGAAEYFGVAQVKESMCR